MMIRTAVLEDLPAIVGIYNESISGRKATADTESITVNSRLDWFYKHENKRPLWVLEQSGIVTGWLSLQDFYGRPAYQATAEVSIYIASRFHGQGKATALLSHLLKECKNLSISTLLALIFAHNETSIHLFKRHGFKQWGYLPQIAKLDALEKDVVILGLRILAR